MKKLTVLSIVLFLFGTFLFVNNTNAQKIFNNKGDSVSLSFENILCAGCLDLLQKVQVFQNKNCVIFEEICLEPGITFGAKVLLNQFNEVDSICSGWVSISPEKRNLFTNFLSSNSGINTFFISFSMRTDPMLKENLSKLFFAISQQKNKDVQPW